MRFGVAKFDSHFPDLFSHSEKGFCINWVFFPGSSRSRRKKLHNGDEHVPAPLPRMRQNLGQSAAQYLRRLFLTARSHLRLRFDSFAHFTRPVCLARTEHMALSRAIAAAGGISTVAAGGLHAAG